MKPSQIVLVGVALVAALGAGFMVLTMNGDEPKLAKTVKKKPPVKVKMVLVADKAISMGNRLKRDNLAWREWPEKSIQESFVLRNKKPEAIKEYAEGIARSSFYDGEPIRDEKVVHSNAGYLSAILPAGKRAISVKVDVGTSAGGFILPNDHVDVILHSKSKKGWNTEVVVENARVLAIDQIIEEKDGKKAKVGSTATLELTPEQTQIVSVSSRIAKNKLVLALRSVEDSNPSEGGSLASHLLSGNNRNKTGAVKLIRFGKESEWRPKK